MLGKHIYTSILEYTTYNATCTDGVTPADFCAFVSFLLNQNFQNKNETLVRVYN